MAMPTTSPMGARIASGIVLLLILVAIARLDRTTTAMKTAPEPPMDRMTTPSGTGSFSLRDGIDSSVVMALDDADSTVSPTPEGTEEGEQGDVWIDGDQTLSSSQVERPVVPVPSTGAPRYPEILLSAGIEGQVIAQFVVDTLGRVEPESFIAISSDHDLFTASVRIAMPALRFLPAESGGRKVKQLVRQTFVFNRQR